MHHLARRATSPLHPLLRKASSSFKAHKPWNHRYLHTAVLSTHASAQECLKDKLLQASGLCTTLDLGSSTHCVPSGEQATVKTLETALWKQNTRLAFKQSYPRRSSHTPVLQHLSSEPHSWPTQSRSFMQRSGLGYSPSRASSSTPRALRSTPEHMGWA